MPTNFTRLHRPESVRFYGESLVLCVTASGVVFEGRIIEARERQADKTKRRFLLLEIQTLQDYVSNSTVTGRAQDGRDLFDVERYRKSHGGSTGPERKTPPWNWLDY